MCHTDFMKKSLLLFVPVLIALSSCDQLRVGYVNESHSAGFADSRSTSSANANSYTYFNGDTIDTTNPNVAHLTFNCENSGSNMAKEEIAPLINCDVDNFFNEVVDASYVGVKKNTALIVGANSSNDGNLTLSFNSNIVDVVIKACPYYTNEIVGFTDRVEHDENVAIAVNTSRYYKLTYSRNSETNEVTMQEARYHFAASDTNQINIKVGPQRALIEEITVYYSIS